MAQQHAQKFLALVEDARQRVPGLSVQQAKEKPKRGEKVMAR